MRSDGPEQRFLDAQEASGVRAEFEDAEEGTPRDPDEYTECRLCGKDAALIDGEYCASCAAAIDAEYGPPADYGEARMVAHFLDRVLA